jgi:hypothetical protein
MPIEINQGNCLHINYHHIESQLEKLIQVLQEQLKSFTWDYHKMKGIHPNTFSHHIYTQSDTHPIKNP